jgi:hypothetical protein
MSAGSTGLPVNTRIKLTHCVDHDDDMSASIYEGITGRLQQIYPGLIWPGEQYRAGLFVDEEFESVVASRCMNILSDDEFEVID